ncbi:unnamed protein product [Rotaria sp. Silwood2]|nr:unnamed protein product [Rotaria sp. Silwood2]CAF4242505.1 unnamed protein product [Rotaria sp. Silwood2]
MEIMLAALFFLAQNESGSQSAIPEAVLMCVLIVITIGVQFVMKSSFDPLTYYLPVDAEEFSRVEVPISGKFVWAKTAISVLRLPGTTRGTDAVNNIRDMVVERYDNTMENTYMHPAIRDPKPIIWIAHDKLGIAANEVQRTRASELDISMSTEGAWFDEMNNIQIDGLPPDYVEMIEKTTVQCRF